MPPIARRIERVSFDPTRVQPLKACVTFGTVSFGVTL